MIYESDHFDQERDVCWGRPVLNWQWIWYLIWGQVYSSRVSESNHCQSLKCAAQHSAHLMLIDEKKLAVQKQLLTDSPQQQKSSKTSAMRRKKNRKSFSHFFSSTSDLTLDIFFFANQIGNYLRNHLYLYHLVLLVLYKVYVILDARVQRTSARI